jgi:hypothetical protein
MKLINTLLGSVIFSGAVAHPGNQWKEKLVQIEAEVARRAARPVDGPDDSSELLGDLVKPGPTSPLGKVLVLILSRTV